MDHVHSDRATMRIGAIFGIGLAYANSKRETVVKNEDGGVVFELKKVLSDNKPSATSEVASCYVILATLERTFGFRLEERVFRCL